MVDLYKYLFEEEKIFGINGIIAIKPEKKKPSKKPGLEYVKKLRIKNRIKKQKDTINEKAR